MKSLIVTIAILTISLADQAFSQGSFVNLGFDDPITPLVPDDAGQVPISSGLPGWTGYVGERQVNTVTYNTISIGAPEFSLQGPGSGYTAFNGDYCVLFQPFTWPFYVGSPAIGQTGTIPADAQSLQFYAGGVGLEVNFAGQSLAIVDLGPAANGYQHYGVDVSAFAGATGELRFTSVRLFGSLDGIQFSDSPIAVPEPEVFALAVFGLFGLLIGRRPSIKMA